MKIRLLFLATAMLLSGGFFQSCIDKDVKKSRKVEKARGKAKKKHSTRHRNHKKLAH